MKSQHTTNLWDFNIRIDRAVEAIHHEFALIGKANRKTFLMDVDFCVKDNKAE